MPKKQKRGLGVEGGSLGKDYRWRARMPGTKRPSWEQALTEGSVLEPYTSTRGRIWKGDSLSKCPINPEKRENIDKGWVSGDRYSIIRECLLCSTLQVQ